MEQVLFTRRQLYNLVWSESLLSLSKKYQISDVGLRKMCIRMSVPTPKAGYWEKKDAGKYVAKPPLTKKYTGEDTIKLAMRQAGDSPKGKDKSVWELENKFKEDPKMNISVTQRLSTNNKLIIGARDSFEERKRYLSNGMINTGLDQLDIKVAPENVSRSLRFMDLLIKMLESRGHSITVGVNTKVVVGNQEMKIYLREKLRRVTLKKQPWDSYEYYPTGVLAFRLDDYGSKEWKDGKKLLESYILEIVAEIEIRGKGLLAAQIEREKEHFEWERKDKIRREQEEQKKEELLNFHLLLNTADRWYKANNIRLFIEALEKKATIEDRLTEQAKKYIEWARKKTDWFDPSVEIEDELLADVDRNTLNFERKQY